MTTIDPTALGVIAGTRREYLARSDLDTVLDALPALVAAYVERESLRAEVQLLAAERDSARADAARIIRERP